MNLDHFGFKWDKPVTRMIRVINLLRRFWLGETINYNDEFFSFKDAKLQIQTMFLKFMVKRDNTIF